MNSDSSILKTGRSVIQHVKNTSTFSSDDKLITETLSPLHPQSDLLLPVLHLYALFFTLLALLIAFLGWYYLKQRNETARLMVQNNMSPDILFRPDGRDKKTISKSLKAGIILIALSVALIANDLFMAHGLARYSGPIFILVPGLTMILIHFLNSRKNRL